MSPTITAKTSLWQWIFKAPLLVWHFSENDLATFLIPDTAFGILGALGSASISKGVPPSATEVLQRLPMVILYNWVNLLCHNLANQWPPLAVEEDRLNKPWRPIPQGKVTSQQARRAMFVLVPLTLAINQWLGVYAMGTVAQTITWLYNGLGGSDEPFVRDMLLSVAYAMFNAGSLQIALGPGAQINDRGNMWILIVSGIILTTMQIQDLKDMPGDRLRKRLTMPLYLGEEASRQSIAVFVCLWGFVCAWFWHLSFWASLLPVLPALWVAWAVLRRRSLLDDKRTWQVWCFWLGCLYLLPIIGS